MVSHGERLVDETSSVLSFVEGSIHFHPLNGEEENLSKCRLRMAGVLRSHVPSANCAKKITTSGVVYVSGRRFMQHAQEGFVRARGEIGPEMDFHAQSSQTQAPSSFLFVLQILIIPQLLLVKWSKK